MMNEEQIKVIEKVSKKLKFLRQMHNYTVKQLSASVEIKVKKILGWENCTLVIKSQDVIKLAKFFNVKTDYLLEMDEY